MSDTPFKNFKFVVFSDAVLNRGVPLLIKCNFVILSVSVSLHFVVAVPRCSLYLIYKMSVSKEQKEYHMCKLRTHYKLIDKHNTGYISHEGFRQMAEKLKGFARMLQHEEKALAVDAAFLAVSDVLKLKEGVNYAIEDLVKSSCQTILSMSKKDARTITDNVHNAIFDVADANEDGFISLQEYKVYFHILGHDISDEEITQSFNAIDSNKDEKISREEFLEAAFDYFINVDESEVAKVFLGHLET